MAIMNPYEYVKNEVDLIISKYILVEEKRFSTAFENKRNRYYENIDEIKKNINDKSGIFLPWSRLFEEGMFVLFELSNVYKKQKKSQTPYYLLLNVLKLLNSIKLLLNSGYYESSCIIYRSVIENFQLELISLSDINESKKILKEYDNTNDYWYKNIKSHKNEKKIKVIFEEIKFKDIDLILPNKEYINELSKYVHGSTNSAFIFEANIFNPTIVNYEPFGIINFNSSEYYMELVNYLIKNIYANMELILNKKTWFVRTKDWEKDMINVLINYNVFVSCFNYYIDQYQSNRKLWNLEEFYELIERHKGKNK
jgi:hypothetical protein